MKWLLLCFVLFAGAPLAEGVPKEDASILITAEQRDYITQKLAEQNLLIERLKDRLIHATGAGIKCV